ncbi:MAG: hypothetical protein MUC83_07600 [Pirellula sp.]|nr:hypothetical protein [Pirellula sp.]
MKNDEDKSIRLIEMIGGPFDGRWQKHRMPVQSLPRESVWLVCNEAFRLMESETMADQPHETHGHLTSVVLYRLVHTEGKSNYTYSGAISPRMFCSLLQKVDQDSRKNK